MRLPTVQKRNAFTLVELLVVIAIIAILMALTVGVMSKVFNYLDETKVVTEVGRLAQGCEQFKSTFGRYPPAKIILCEDPAQYGVLASGAQPIATLASFSSEYLSSVFPGLLTSGAPINWTGRANFVPANFTNYLLEGEESLVYFLSGPRANNAAIGFNTDKSLLPVPSTGARLGPFFEFEPSRVIPSTINTRFHVYKDTFGTPYAYFYARSPGMNNYWFVGAPIFQGTGLTAAQQSLVSDCPILTATPNASSYGGTPFGYVPLWQSTVGTAAIQFFKGDSFQIVSAGKDKLFGCGGRWNQADPENSAFGFMNFPAPVATIPADLQATYDNITNVSNGRIVPK